MSRKPHCAAFMVSGRPCRDRCLAGLDVCLYHAIKRADALNAQKEAAS